MDLPTVVVLGTLGLLLVMASFAHKAARDGADKGVYHVLWGAAALLFGVFAALAWWAGVL